MVGFSLGRLDGQDYFVPAQIRSTRAIKSENVQLPFSPWHVGGCRLAFVTALLRLLGSSFKASGTAREANSGLITIGELHSGCLTLDCKYLDGLFADFTAEAVGRHLQCR